MNEALKRSVAVVLIVALLATLYLQLFRPGNEPNVAVVNQVSVRSGSRIGTANYEYPISNSHWIAAEKKRAAGVLASRQVDVLVLPIQADGHSLDIVGRSLISRSLSAAIEREFGVSVANPDLVEQAFGAAAREISEDDVVLLRALTQAKYVVYGYASHNQNGELALRFELEKAPGENAPGLSRESVIALTGIAFSDTELPYFRFLENRDRILDSLGRFIERGSKTEPLEAPITASDALPATPKSMSGVRRESLRSAALLQFLGVLHPTGIYDRSRERLFERSLVILEGSSGSDEVAILRARALLNLHRRPAAVAQLEGRADAAVAVLRDLLMGNVAGLETDPDLDTAGVGAMVGGIERHQLRLEAGLSVDSAFVDALLDKNEPWAPLLYPALTELDPWSEHSVLPAKLALDSYFPLRRFDLEPMLDLGAITGSAPSEFRLARIALQHLDALYEDEDIKADLASSSWLEPRELDTLDLIRELVVANAIHQIRHLDHELALPVEAIELAVRYEPLLSGHPDYMMQWGMSELRLADDRSDPPGSPLRETAFDRLRQGAIWSQGQTKASQGVIGRSHIYFPTWGFAMSADELARASFDSDWPNRPDWGTNAASKDLEERLEHCLSYSLSDIDCFDLLHNLYVRRGSLAAARQLLADNQGRFNGYPKRTEIFAYAALRTGDSEIARSIFSAAITAGSPDWSAYWGLGSEMIRAAQPADALEVFMRYPDFLEGEVQDPVRLSNEAHMAAMYLYRTGSFEESRPLFEIAASLRTGSAATMDSRARLAILEQDLGSALDWIVERLRRYDSPRAYREFAMLSVALGDSDSARQLLTAAEARLERDPLILSGMLATHRAEGASLQEIVEWASGIPITRVVVAPDRLPMRYVFQSQYLDRDVTAELSETLRAMDPGPFLGRNSRGRVNFEGTLIDPPAFFEDEPRAEATATGRSERIEGRLTQVASALASMQAGDFQGAYLQFDEISRVFDLAEFLPYYAWASAQTGNTERIERYLRNAMPVRQRAIGPATMATGGAAFNEVLCQALLAGYAGDHVAALTFLELAAADRPSPEARAIEPGYQLLETAELLFAHTGEAGYREFMADKSRRISITEPAYSWAHAFLALYSTEISERRSALLRALYLDPASSRGLRAPEEEIERALEERGRGSPWKLAFEARQRSGIGI